MSNASPVSDSIATSGIISKVWSFCNILRDDGVSHGDYLEQLTDLLFLKMADDFTMPSFSRKLNIPEACSWESLTSWKGAERPLHHLVSEAITDQGILSQISALSLYPVFV
jgi:type I restriction enzyme M protein